MAYPIETAFYIALQHPDRRVAFGQRNKALANGVGAGAALPEPIGVAVGDRLRDGRQCQRMQRLHGSVLHGGNAQWAQLAVLLRNVEPAQWEWPVASTFQVLHCCVFLLISPP